MPSQAALKAINDAPDRLSVSLQASSRSAERFLITQVSIRTQAPIERRIAEPEAFHKCSDVIMFPKNPDAVEFAVNNAWQESIRTTPFMLNYGQQPRLPGQVSIDGYVPAASKFTGEWQMTVREARILLNGAEQRHSAFETRRRQADRAVKAAQGNIKDAQEKQKLQADERRSFEPSFKIGTKVLLSTKHIQLKNPGARKLLPPLDRTI